MSTSNVQGVISWRRRAKQRLITAFGGSCGLCGYDRCDRNLAFHHIDPTEKDFEFGRFQSASWAKIISEVRKCVMLCHNCHGEVHHGIVVDLSKCQRFDESYAEYTRVHLGPRGILSHIIPGPKPSRLCEHCGKVLIKSQTLHCSRSCRSHAQITVDVEKVRALLRGGASCADVARASGVSPKTIRKWAHRLDIPLRPYRQVTGGPGEIRTHGELSLV